ncbi:MAG: hypothetical protein ACTSWY_15190 [Promethearchaeota archaeon]
MNKEKTFIERQYFCSLCKKMHKVKLKKELVKIHDKFPFSYFHLHGPVDDLLSTLYVDANLNIRGAETVKLTNSDNIFSQQQAMKIVKNLMDELTRTQQELNELQDKYQELQKKTKS